MPFEYAIVLTGSIATGKSTVGAYFQDNGFEIIDADTIAHKTLDEVKLQITSYFGEHLIVNNKIDRKALGKIIFSDNTKRKTLEALLHPLIYNKILTQGKLLDNYKKPYFIDIPLFFESGRYNISNVLVVYTSKNIQLDRLIKREGITKYDAQSRIETQIDIEIKKKMASYVIDNNSDEITLYKSCKECIKWVEGLFK